MPKNAFYAQSGGVTAVINATACGLIETARQHTDQIGKVYAGRNGIIGALTEDLIDTSQESDEAIAALRHTPSGAFGSCRFKLKGLDESKAEYERLIEVFKAHDIGYFFYNGGGILKIRHIKCHRLVKKWVIPSPALVYPRQLITIYPSPIIALVLALSLNMSQYLSVKPALMLHLWQKRPLRFL